MCVSLAIHFVKTGARNKQCDYLRDNEIVVMDVKFNILTLISKCHVSLRKKEEPNPISIKSAVVNTMHDASKASLDCTKRSHIQETLVRTRDEKRRVLGHKKNLRDSFARKQSCKESLSSFFRETLPLYFNRLNLTLIK